jgi:2-methylcitrate dehydratase PrpD
MPPSDPSLARRIARAALAADLALMPPEVAAKARLCLLDFLSCAFEAGPLPWSGQAVAIARPLADGATIIGRPGRFAHPDAAFANAALGHGLVREDMHAGSIAHLGVVVWPTLLALAERTQVGGAELLAAAVVGYEAGARIGRALMSAELARLFRPTGLVGPLGAALAGSRLIGLDEDGAVHALALAANTVGGLNQWPHTGASEMYFHPAFAARNAFAAIELAAQGATASEAILEGEAGLFAAFKRARPAAPIELFADGRAEILAVFNKPVPACNFAQTPCQAALRVAAPLRHDRGAGLRAVPSIAVRVPEASKRYPGCDFAGPFASPLQAKMSIQFNVAAALARNGITEDNYRWPDDPAIARLVAIMTLASDPALSAAFPGAQGAEVEVRLADGTRIVERLPDVVAASEPEVRARFRAAAGAVLGDARAAAIERFIDDIAAERDAGALAALCAPSPDTLSARGLEAPEMAS